jgi:hypothetical protein
MVMRSVEKPLTYYQNSDESRLWRDFCLVQAAAQAFSGTRNNPGA